MTLSIEAIANRDRYYQETAKANGQNYYPGAAFTVSPANVQKFIQDIQKDLAIMKKIKYRSVPQRSSQTLSFGVTRGIHSRGNTTNHNAADNKQVNTYTTAERKYRMLIPFADIDTWQGYVRFVDEMKRLYKENYVHELLYIGMMGIDRHADPESFYDSGNPWDYLQHVDRGWRVVLESLNASNVITGWEVGTNVIIYGKDREIPLESVVATSEAAGAKTGIPLAGHGFITGGQIFVLGETGYDTV
ncbi:MAG: P2 family phage major capsid protein, partial [Deltaproteobacteria bacterium]|nr:P2 family phage major capsid protein [Deltaproteobacteria bacterium]